MQLFQLGNTEEFLVNEPAILQSDIVTIWAYCRFAHLHRQYDKVLLNF